MSPQAHKKRVDAPVTMEARLVTTTIKGRKVKLYNVNDRSKTLHRCRFAELYSHRREIELGYRDNEAIYAAGAITLRSKTQTLVIQELWGMLLAYNLLQFMMCQMAYSLKSVMLYQIIGFKQASIFLMSQLQLLPAVATGQYPNILRYILDMAERRKRSYLKAVRKSPSRYATRPSRKRELS